LTIVRPREVVHLIGHLRLGAGRYVLHLALEQLRRGHAVRVVVGPDVDRDWATDVGMESELLSAGINVVRNVDFFHRDLSSLLQAAEALASHVSSPDSIVNAHSAIPAAVARWAGARVVVATCHGVRPDRPPEQDLQDALAYASCDAVTTPSGYWATRLNERMGVREAVVIPVGLDLKRYPPLGESTRSANRPLRIVSVCELSQRKGVDILIDSMSEVWKHFPGVELHIMGDGDRSTLLREQAGRVDRDRRISFHGFVTNPYLRLGEYDLFALASRSDNMPVAIMEAMLAGLPVVATAVGGVRETVLQSHCGVLASEPSAGAVATALLRILREGRNGLSILGRRGEEYARTRFSVEVTADTLFKVYRRAARSRGLAEGGH
jgi:glycosyltransferase involved in cell wall biosynthesis